MTPDTPAPRKRTAAEQSAELARMLASTRLVYDGVEYAVPWPVTPREDGRIRRICGWTALEALRRVSSADLEASSALLIVAKTRAEGACDEDTILDDAAFVDRFVLRRELDDDEADAGPPADAGAELEAPAVSPHMTSTLAPTGHPT